jgi:hypothetical protein
MPLSLPLPQVIAIATDKIYRHATLCHAHDTLGIASRWLTRARTVLLYRWYVYIAHDVLGSALSLVDCSDIYIFVCVFGFVTNRPL